MPKLKPDPDAKRRNRVSISISKDHGAIADRLRDGTKKSRAEIVEISLELAEKYYFGVEKMANTATNTTGYGYVKRSGDIGAQVYAVSNGLAIRVAFVQHNGQIGAWTDLDEEFEWDGRILPTVADCESELGQ